MDNLKTKQGEQPCSQRRYRVASPAPGECRTHMLPAAPWGGQTP